MRGQDGYRSLSEFGQLVSPSIFVRAIGHDHRIDELRVEQNLPQFSISPVSNPRRASGAANALPRHSQTATSWSWRRSAMAVAIADVFASAPSRASFMRTPVKAWWQSD